MKEVHTEIEINAEPGQVWTILSDFEKYEQWNPFITRIAGQAKEGSKISININTPAGTKRQYEPIITKVEQNREIRWLGKSAIPGFLSGEHVFTIEPLQHGRVRFVHREIFNGFLSSLFGKNLDNDVKKGFEEMNKALKNKAESHIK